MNIAKYCKGLGMNLEQFETFDNNMKATATALLQVIKQNHKAGTGVYYPTDELFAEESDEAIKGFIIQELKNLGVEFYDNNTLYRY